MSDNKEPINQLWQQQDVAEPDISELGKKWRNMPDDQDPLNRLWQQQDVVKPDLSEVSKKWRKVRFKQCCYVVLDVLSVIIPFVFIWLNADKLEPFSMTFMVGFMSLAVAALVYITWLRRFSFGWSDTSTDQHIQRLQKQIESNIKIANLSLHSVWFLAVLTVVLYGGLYYFEVFPADRFIRKVTITLAIYTVMFPCIWIWASKRKKRFTKELAELSNLLEGSKI